MLHFKANLLTPLPVEEMRAKRWSGRSKPAWLKSYRVLSTYQKAVLKPWVMGTHTILFGAFFPHANFICVSLLIALTFFSDYLTIIEKRIWFLKLLILKIKSSSILVSMSYDIKMYH